MVHSLWIIPTVAVIGALPMDNPYCSCKLTRVVSERFAHWHRCPSPLLPVSLSFSFTAFLTAFIFHYLSLSFSFTASHCRFPCLFTLSVHRFSPPLSALFTALRHGPARRPRTKPSAGWTGRSSRAARLPLCRHHPLRPLLKRLLKGGGEARQNYAHIDG